MRLSSWRMKTTVNATIHVQGLRAKFENVIFLQECTQLDMPEYRMRNVVSCKIGLCTETPPPVMFSYISNFAFIHMEAVRALLGEI